jgi:hypothetical protein
LQSYTQCWVILHSVELHKQIDEIESKNGVSAITFEQIQNVFIQGSRAAEKYLLVDDVEKREMLQKLLSNITIENGNVAQIQFKSPYDLLAATPKNADFQTLLAVWDSIFLFRLTTILNIPMCQPSPSP